MILYVYTTLCVAGDNEYHHLLLIQIKLVLLGRLCEDCSNSVGCVILQLTGITSLYNHMQQNFKLVSRYYIYIVWCLLFLWIFIDSNFHWLWNICEASDILFWVIGDKIMIVMIKILIQFFRKPLGIFFGIKWQYLWL